MKKFLLAFCVLLAAFASETGAVNVTTTTQQSGYNNQALLQTMQNNLGQLLTEINAAHEQKRDLNLAGMAMDDYAKRMLTNIWSNMHFYCDDEEVVEEGLPMKSGMLMQNIAYIVEPDDEAFDSQQLQMGSVEFDNTGKISDFRFALDVHTAATFGQCQDVVETERRMKILKYVEHFRTAYCQKDLATLRQVFSDDALIITGNVVEKYDKETGLSAASVTYKKQNKEEYLESLQRAFTRNKYIEVKFSQIAEHGIQDECGGITRSRNNPNMYGVTLFQEWKSSRYSDEGYVFLLWDFTDEDRPVIHVRTWQPEFVGGKKMTEEEIFSLSDFEL